MHERKALRALIPGDGLDHGKESLIIEVLLTPTGVSLEALRMRLEVPWST